MSRLFLLLVCLTISLLASKAETYPEASSKKGLQVEMVDDALALGIKHAAINVNLSQLISPSPSPSAVAWTQGSTVFHFNEAYLARLDRDISALSNQGVLVNLIILVYASSDETINRRLLHPNYDPAAPNRLGAFNNRSEEGRAWLSATFAFMANRWSRADQAQGKVVGYIIGNEVNSHWWWSNCGHVTMTEFADDYLATVRLAHNAIRTQAPWPRVYLSLEHHWNIHYPAGDETQAFPAKAFLDYFAEKAKEGGDFAWHLAFHPYPENLFEPRFWRDRSATDSPDTQRITFKNLSILTDYFKREPLLFQEKPRRIILSEQGFHTPDGPEGESVQAAAYCYAYKIVERLDGIDAFILHRHVDHPHEGGLRLGLRRYTPGEADHRPKKKIYDCFRLADTPEWEGSFAFALPIIGIDRWENRP